MYGGTKEEMARLLDDASLLAGKEFKMGNFSDVIEAIHVIQENMGITGTTAEEASGTINGSILAWKSALDNLLTGIGRNENIDQLVDNLVDSTEDVIANLVPAIRRASEGFMQVMRVAVVKVGPQVMDAFRDIWNNKLPTMLTSAANGIIGLINDLFGTNIPKIETIELPSWGDISAKVILWAETVRNRIRAITKWTIGIFTAPTETATEMTTTFTRWWEETAKPTILSISTWALNLFGMPETDENSITSHVQTWWGGIVEWVQNACVWTLQIFGFAPDAAEKAVQAVKQWFAGVIKTIGGALKLVFNWASGMDASSIADQAKTIFNDAKELLGDAMQIVWNLVPPKLQETIGGLIESLQTFWNENKEGIMGLFDPENSAIAGFVSWISDLLSDPKFGETLVEAVQAFLGAVKTIADALFSEEGKDTLMSILSLLISTLNLIKPVLSLIQPALSIIAAVIDAIADALAWWAGEGERTTPWSRMKDAKNDVDRYVALAEMARGQRVSAYSDEGVRVLTDSELDALYEKYLAENVGGYANMTPQEKILAKMTATNPYFGLYGDYEWWNKINAYGDSGGGGGGMPPQGSGLSSLASLIEDLALPNGIADKAMQDVVTELETVKTELQGLRNDLLTAVQSLMNRPISIDGQIITQIISQGITRKARTSFG